VTFLALLVPLDFAGSTSVTLAVTNFTHVLKDDLRVFRKTSPFVPKTWQDLRLYVNIDSLKFGPVLLSLQATAGVFVPTASRFPLPRFLKSYDLAVFRVSWLLIRWG
jgi:hypothetical protein